MKSKICLPNQDSAKPMLCISCLRWNEKSFKEARHPIHDKGCRAFTQNNPARVTNSKK